MPDLLLVFKADENLPDDIAAVLREASSEGAAVASQGLAGPADARLAEALRRDTP